MFSWWQASSLTESGRTNPLIWILAAQGGNATKARTELLIGRTPISVENYRNPHILNRPGSFGFSRRPDAPIRSLFFMSHDFTHLIDRHSGFHLPKTPFRVRRSEPEIGTETYRSEKEQ
jgi:hypothetical protein